MGKVYIYIMYFPIGNMKLKQLGTSRIADRNRIVIPQEVLDVLPSGDRLSWELDEETNCVCVFMGHERFLRKNHNNQCKREKDNGGEDGKTDTST